jgi:phosphopantothenoylcysteine decarboxylase / phosphopantothenate---cysteine ligase
MITETSPLKNKILLIVTGSIACYKAADLTSQLRKQNYEVQVVLSDSAQKFVSPLTFEALSGNPVRTSLWEKNESLAHIDLVRWADLILVAPATADFLSHLAMGRSFDLPLALSIAHDFKKPFLIAPAMNPAMLQHPSTQDHIIKLKNWGYQVLPSPEGLTACLEEGSGRMMEPQDLLESISYFLTKDWKYSEKRKKILITCGGTSVPIDSVRKITNLSSGLTGFTLAQSLLRQGHQVTILHSKTSLRGFNSESLKFYTLTKNLDLLPFETPDDLDEKLLNLGKNFEPDVLIQCAAISDFDVEKMENKISSEQDFKLLLKRRKKSLALFYEYFPQTPVVAFKLTAGYPSYEDLSKKIHSLVSIPNVHWVIHNHLEEVLSQNFRYTVYNRSLDSVAQLEDIKSLGQWIHREFTQASETP